MTSPSAPGADRSAARAMATVPHLPSEILLMILERLPASFFQQDVRRLAVSKRWYSLAWPTFYPRIEFTPRVISRLVHRKSRSVDRSRALLRKSLRRVNIVLEGVGPRGRRDNLCFDTPANLARFCLMLLEFRELKAVRFAARWQNMDWPADPLQRDYLPMRSLEPYLTLLTHVTSLDLDLCGTDVTDAAGAPVHLCPHVRPLLARLRSLRLRLRSLCHMCLWPPDPLRPVSVADLTLDLYLGHVSDHNPKLNMTRLCSPALWDGWESPLGRLRPCLRRLVAHMPEPRRARVVHLAADGDMHVWDAATDACVRDETVRPRRPRPAWNNAPPQCFSPLPPADDWPWDLAAAAAVELVDVEDVVSSIHDTEDDSL